LEEVSSLKREQGPAKDVDPEASGAGPGHRAGWQGGFGGKRSDLRSVHGLQVATALRSHGACDR